MQNFVEIRNKALLFFTLHMNQGIFSFKRKIRATSRVFIKLFVNWAFLLIKYVYPYAWKNKT